MQKLKFKISQPSVLTTRPSLSDGLALIVCLQAKAEFPSHWRLGKKLRSETLPCSDCQRYWLKLKSIFNFTLVGEKGRVGAGGGGGGGEADIIIFFSSKSSFCNIPTRNALVFVCFNMRG